MNFPTITKLTLFVSQLIRSSKSVIQESKKYSEGLDSLGQRRTDDGIIDSGGKSLQHEAQQTKSPDWVELVAKSKRAILVIPSDYISKLINERPGEFDEVIINLMADNRIIEVKGIDSPAVVS